MSEWTREDFPPGTRVSAFGTDGEKAITGTVVEASQDRPEIANCYLHIDRDDGKKGGDARGEWLIDWIDINSCWANLRKLEEAVQLEPANHIAGLSREHISRDDWDYIMGGGGMIPTDNRIKYDDVRGCWKVIHQGQEKAETFKTSEAAYAHLKALQQPGAKA